MKSAVAVSAQPTFVFTLLADGAQQPRRPAPSTPGASLRVSDYNTATTSSTSYTHLSGASSVSKSSTGMLHADLSLGLSSHQQHLTSGMMPSKSQASCLSHSSAEDDTINCRPADDNRTHGSLGAGLASSRSGGGNTGTVTLPAGIAGTLNLAAGAAALAALGSGSAGGAGSGSGGGGNNTGNVSLGLKRFGLKSKAVRITGDAKPGAAAEVASPAHAAPGHPVSAEPAAGAGTSSLQQQLRTGAAAAPSAPQQPAPVQLSTQSQQLAASGQVEMAAAAHEDSEEALSRKRRAAAAAAQSPARMVASVVVSAQEEGSKRRHSPDAAAHAALGPSTSVAAVPFSRQALSQSEPVPTILEQWPSASTASDMQIDLPEPAAVGAVGPATGGWGPQRLAGAAPGDGLAARHAPPATPAAAPTPLGAGGLGALGRPAATPLAFATPGVQVRQQLPCADENMAPAHGGVQVSDENQAPGTANVGGGAAGGVGSMVKAQKGLALQQPGALPNGGLQPTPLQQHQQPVVSDGREPLR